MRKIETLLQSYSKLNGFLNSLGIKITSWVGTMWCAILFAILAVSGLPQALAPGGIGFVQWFSTAFLQLVLLSIIMVGQKAQDDKHDESISHHESHGEKLDQILSTLQNGRPNA